MDRRHLLAALGAAAVCNPARADLPTRTLSVVVPSVPGGTTDILGRFIAQALAVSLSRTVVVENAGGAGGVIGMQRATRPPFDGGTMLIGNQGTLLAAPLLNQAGGLDPHRDLRAIGLFGEVPAALAASRASGIASMAALLDRARAAPDRLTLGVSGVGAATHLAAAALIEASGMRLTLVPYRGGGQSLIDLAAGTLDLIMELTPGIIPAAAAGHAVPLAVGGRNRAEGLPQVPTFTEAGIANYPGLVWYALVAPAGAPDVAIARLVEGLERALAAPALAARFLELAVAVPPPEARGPAALRRLMADEGARIAELVRSGRIREA